MSDAAAVIPEYEVFRNEKNALAFFFFRQPVLDQNPQEGPFWFTVEDNMISAGTSAHHAVFDNVQPEIADIAKQRGVIMLVEFENKQPVRCTPCYLSDKF